MMKTLHLVLLLITVVTSSCTDVQVVNTPSSSANSDQLALSNNEFQWESEIVDDIGIYRYEVPDKTWEGLSLDQKQLIYYLSQAGLSGRDIIWDQRYKYNLELRNILEAVYKNYAGSRSSEEWLEFSKYTKKVWFSSGIHDVVSNSKHIPSFSQKWFNDELASLEIEIGAELMDAMFNKNTASKMIGSNNIDKIVEESSVNFYDEDITTKEVKSFYEKNQQPKRLEVGINTKLIKNEFGEISESVYSENGLYGEAVKQVIYWLEKAINVAETESQKKSLVSLVEYYKTGDLHLWENHSKDWVKCSDTSVDFINGFIEKYDDPLGRKASFQSLVYVKDPEYTNKLSKLTENVLWLEQNAPINDKYKKDIISPTSAQVVTVIGGSGYLSPVMPNCIGLPNSEYVREHVGTKSLICGNTMSAKNEVLARGLLSEFACDEDEILMELTHGKEAAVLYDLFRMIGYSFSKIEDGVGEPSVTLKSYSSVIDQSVAQLYTLYYALEPKIVGLGLASSAEVGRTVCDSYFRSGLLTNLRGLELGEEFLDSKMKSKYVISNWIMDNSEADVIEAVYRDGKVYYNILDYSRLQKLIGELLHNVVTIKCTGDYEGAKDFVAGGNKDIDPNIHKGVIDRTAVLKLPSISGFIHPTMNLVSDSDNEITDITLSYDKSFSEQMLDYSSEFTFLGNSTESAFRVGAAVN